MNRARGPGPSRVGLFAARPGGCLSAPLLSALRARLDDAITTASRDRFEATIGTAARVAAAADRFATLWRSRRHYQEHLDKRVDAGDARDAKDYRDAILRTLDQAELILVATSPSEPAQIVIESASWAIIYSRAELVTAYPKRDKAESFLAQHTRLNWTLGEVVIDDAVRRYLKKLRAGIAQLDL